MKKENDNTSSREAKNQTDSTIRKFFVNNAGMKLISVIIAIIVWAVIINIVPATMQKPQARGHPRVRNP